MIAFRLRHRVEIQALTHTIDANTGARGDVWTTFVANEPAAIAPLSGREFIAAQAVQAGLSTRITIRKRDGIVPTMRVIHNGEIYNVLAVLPDVSLERHLTLLCESGVNNG